MENHNKKNYFFDGFFWGALVGGGLVFFLGTEKGKKLMKLITEEGMNGATKLEEIFQTYKGVYHDEEEENEERPHRKKRFFKGLPKRINSR